MTVEEIARLLGVQTTEEIAEECGFEPGELGVVEAALESEMARPCLVLDYRGAADARRDWGMVARVGGLPPARLPRALDPRTGLHAEPKKRRGKK